MEENKKKRVLVLCAEDSDLCEKAMQYTSCNVYKPGDEVHVVSPEFADQQVQGDKTETRSNRARLTCISCSADSCDSKVTSND